MKRKKKRIFNKHGIEMSRLNLKMPVIFIDDIKAYCKKKNLSYTAFIIMAKEFYLENNK